MNMINQIDDDFFEKLLKILPEFEEVDKEPIVVITQALDLIQKFTEENLSKLCKFPDLEVIDSIMENEININVLTTCLELILKDSEVKNEPV